MCRILVSKDTQKVEVTLRINNLQHFGVEETENVQVVTNITQDFHFERPPKGSNKIANRGLRLVRVLVLVLVMVLILSLVLVWALIIILLIHK